MCAYKERIEKALVKLEQSEAAMNRTDCLRTAIKSKFTDIEESKKKGVTYRQIAEEIGVEYQNFISTLNRIKIKMYQKNDNEKVYVKKDETINSSIKPSIQKEIKSKSSSSFSELPLNL